MITIQGEDYIEIEISGIKYLAVVAGSGTTVTRYYDTTTAPEWTAEVIPITDQGPTHHDPEFDPFGEDDQTDPQLDEAPQMPRVVPKAPEAPLWQPPSSPDTHMEAEAPEEAPEGLPEVEEADDERLRPTRPYAGMTEGEVAVHEIMGWWKHGRRQVGKLQHATEEQCIAACSLLSPKIQLGLFSRVATDRWIHMREHIFSRMSREVFDQIDQKHFEMKGKFDGKGGPLFDTLPSANPLQAADVQRGVALPQLTPRTTMTVDMARGLGMDDKPS